MTLDKAQNLAEASHTLNITGCAVLTGLAGGSPATFVTWLSHNLPQIKKERRPTKWLARGY